MQKVANFDRKRKKKLLIISRVSGYGMHGANSWGFIELHEIMKEHPEISISSILENQVLGYHTTADGDCSGLNVMRQKILILQIWNKEKHLAVNSARCLY